MTGVKGWFAANQAGPGAIVAGWTNALLMKGRNRRGRGDRQLTVTAKSMPCALWPSTEQYSS
jgi:hypothetical protein